MRMTATSAVVTDTLSEALLVAPPGTSVHNQLPQECRVLGYILAARDLRS